MFAHTYTHTYMGYLCARTLCSLPPICRQSSLINYIEFTQAEMAFSHSRHHPLQSMVAGSDGIGSHIDFCADCSPLHFLCFRFDADFTTRRTEIARPPIYGFSKQPHLTFLDHPSTPFRFSNLHCTAVDEGAHFMYVFAVNLQLHPTS